MEKMRDEAAWAGPKWLKIDPKKSDKMAWAARDGSRWTPRSQIKRHGLPKMVQNGPQQTSYSGKGWPKMD